MSTTDQIKPAFVLQGPSPDVVTLDPNGNAVSAGLQFGGGTVVPAGLSAAQATAVAQMIASGIAALTLDKIPGKVQAANITVAADSNSVETDIAALKAALAPPGSSAPVLTSPPTFSLSAGVAMGSIMTITSGGVTNGSGGAPTTQYQLQGLDGNGVTSPIGSPIAAATAANPTISFVWPTHFGVAGLRLSIVQVLIDPGAGNPQSAPKTSALTAVTTRTAPTFSGGTAPLLSPSGTQAPGVLLTINPGIVAGGNTNVTFTEQFQFEPSGSSTYSDITGATGLTYSATASQGGGLVRGMATPLHSIQGPGAPTATSNAVTISGSAAVTFSAGPTLGSTLTQLQSDAIVPPVLSGGSVDPTCVYRVYCLEAQGAYATPILTYGALPIAGASYTPPDNATFFALTGLATPVGKHFKFDGLFSSGGVGPIPSPLSIAYTCAAASTALVLSVPNNSYTFTMGVQYSAFTPVTVAQGNGGPYTFAYAPISQNPPGFGAIGSTTGTIPLGTPTVTGTVQQSYQVAILVTDTSNSTTATASFIVVVNPVPAVVVQDSDWLSYRHADQPISSLQTTGDQWQLLGGDADAYGIFSSGSLGSISGTWTPGVGITHAGAITNAPAGVNQNLRLGIITDPFDPTRHVWYCAALPSDPATFGHFGRVEYVPGGGNGGQNVGALAKTTTEYAGSLEFCLSSSLDTNAGDGESTVLQVHNTNPLSVAAGPFQFDGPENDVFPNRGVQVARIFQPLNNNGVGGAGVGYNLTYPFVSDNPTWAAGVTTDNVAQNWAAFYSGGVAAHFPRDRNMQLFWFYRGDPVAGGSGSGLGTGTGYLQMYLRDKASNTVVQIANLTNVGIGTNDAPAGYAWDYIKVGLDVLHITGPCWLTIRSVGLMVNSGKRFGVTQLAAYADAH